MPTLLTRNALKSTTNTTPQPRLWQETTGCSSDKSASKPCVVEPTTLGNISKLSNPFLAQLPVGFHTGLIKQFIPRINSTVRWEAISPEHMPADCGGLPNSFYSHYANATWPPESKWNLVDGAPRNWSIEACMPGDQSESPWKSSYDRQDFSEQLFLNVSVMGYGDGPPEGPDSPRSGGIFRITSETTAGYFELPNYKNGGEPGPIIEGDPNDASHCGFDCSRQSYRYESHVRRTLAPRAVPAVSNYQSNDSLTLAVVPNRGVS